MRLILYKIKIKLNSYNRDELEEKKYTNTSYNLIQRSTFQDKDRPRSNTRSHNEDKYFRKDKQKLNRTSKSFVKLADNSFLRKINTREFNIIKNQKYL